MPDFPISFPKGLNPPPRKMKLEIEQAQKRRAPAAATPAASGGGSRDTLRRRQRHRRKLGHEAVEAPGAPSKEEVKEEPAGGDGEPVWRSDELVFPQQGAAVEEAVAAAVAAASAAEAGDPFRLFGPAVAAPGALGATGPAAAPGASCAEEATDIGLWADI